MARIQAIFYQFAKRKDSTKRPSNDTPSVQLPITINDAETSLMAPVIRVQYVADEAYKYTYVFIAQFARYYYISDWKFNGDGTWSAYCTEDVLASWEPEIQASGGYMSRCPSYLRNWDVLDSAYPPSLRKVVVYREYPTGLSADITAGDFIIGVISSGADATTNIGAVKYYLTSRTELQILLNNMISTSTEAWSDINHVGGDVLKSMVNPIQYITSCKWFPFQVRLAGNPQAEQIRLWSWATGARGYPIASTSYIKIPDSYTDGNWYDLLLPNIGSDQGSDVIPGSPDWPGYPPYAQYSLITPWGTFDLDGSIMGQLYHLQTGRPKLSYKLIISLVSGSATFAVSAKVRNGVDSQGNVKYDRYEFFRRDVQIAHDIPIAQASINYVAAAKGAISAVGAAANTAGWYTNPGGNIAGIANGLIDTAAAMLSPSVQSTTNNSTAFTSEIEVIRFQMVRYKTIDQWPLLMGNPWKKHVNHISDPNDSGVGGRTVGYIQMDISDFKPVRETNGVVTLTGTDAEQEAVVENLKNGVYLE